MSEFDMNDIRRLDGGLLLVFRELLVRRQVTEVGRRLGLSPSAVSHALARLRDLFGDPLFIRRSHGLEPTRRALELGPRIEALVELAATTLSPDGRFDPVLSRRRFVVGCPAYVMSAIGGRLLDALRCEAPLASFVSVPLLVDRALDAVRRGDIDLAIGQFGPLPSGLAAEALYEDRYAVIARRDHPDIAGAISLADYNRIAHVVVGGPAATPAYDVDAMEAAYGPLPEPGVVPMTANVAGWESAMLMVASSDAIAECPRSLADRHAERMGLQVLDPPYEAMIFSMQTVRRAGQTDSGLDWFLARLRDAASA